MLVAGSGNELTVTWPVRFKAAFGMKSCKQYLYARDDFGLTGGWWTEVGAWSVGENHAPSVGSVSPSGGSSGHGEEQVFTSTYSDPEGWENIRAAMMLVNDSPSGVGAFYGYYDEDRNQVRLINDAGTGFLGPRTPGEAGAVLENSYVSLDVAGMLVAGSGNELTVTWPVTFKAAFGTKSCKQYLYVRDDFGLTGGWLKEVGSWSVVGG